VTQSAQKLIDLRDNLQGEVKSRVNQAILQANVQVIRIAEQAQSEAGLLTKLPEQVKKPGWRRDFKNHDKTTRRAMTAVEAMERDEQRQWVEKDTAGPRVSLEDELPPPQRPLLSLRVAERGPGSIQPFTGRHSETRRRTLPQGSSVGGQEASCS
jgi:hypothetical protein